MGTPDHAAAAAPIAGADAVDASSAVEFMREALIKISEDEIGAVAELLVAQAVPARAGARRGCTAARPTRRQSVRSWRGSSRPGAGRTRSSSPSARRPCRTRSASWSTASGSLAGRFRRFDEALPGLDGPIRRELAGECLHFADPERHWLWARWMWDPVARTGSLPLLMVEGFDFSGADAGAVYLRVGAATSAVIATADELGFRRMRANPFAVDVYLAAIYGIYLYTVTRLRMTQEFNRVIPQLPDLVRRLLGVYRLEA